GVVGGAELEVRTRLFRERPDAPVPAPPAKAGAAAGHRPEAETSFRPPVSLPKFAVGAVVTTRTLHPAGHTRLPRYARGKRGGIAAPGGGHACPDTPAHGLGEQPQHVYSVRFEARDLWGDAAEPNQRLYLDLWESYLQAV